MAGRLVTGDPDRVNRPGRLAFATFLAVGTLGCSLLPAGPTVVTLPHGDGFPEVPVVLDDVDRVVEKVELAAVDPGSIGPTEIRVADADAVLLTWTGGACDSRVRLKAVVADATVHLGLHIDESGMGCTAAGIGRAITIAFVDSVDASSVVLDSGR